jgi:hypothetical protein
MAIKNAVFWFVTLCLSCRTDDSEECITSIFRVRKISEVGTALELTGKYSTTKRINHYTVVQVARSLIETP